MFLTLKIPLWAHVPKHGDNITKKLRKKYHPLNHPAFSFPYFVDNGSRSCDVYQIFFKDAYSNNQKARLFRQNDDKRDHDIS